MTNYDNITKEMLNFWQKQSQNIMNDDRIINSMLDIFSDMGEEKNAEYQKQSNPASFNDQYGEISALKKYITKLEERIIKLEESNNGFYAGYRKKSSFKSDKSN